MKWFRTLAINCLLYVVTAAVVLCGIAIVAAGEMASVQNDIYIASTGLAAMICVRCRLAGKPLGGETMTLSLGWVTPKQRPIEERPDRMWSDPAQRARPSDRLAR